MTTLDMLYTFLEPFFFGALFFLIFVLIFTALFGLVKSVINWIAGG